MSSVILGVTEFRALAHDNKARSYGAGTRISADRMVRYSPKLSVNYRFALVGRQKLDVHPCEDRPASFEVGSYETGRARPAKMACCLS